MALIQKFRLFMLVSRLLGFSTNLQILKSFSLQSLKMTKALVILSEGAEEMEAVISIDVLRRGGVSV